MEIPTLVPAIYSASNTRRKLHVPSRSTGTPLVHRGRRTSLCRHKQSCDGAGKKKEMRELVELCYRGDKHLIPASQQERFWLSEFSGPSDLCESSRCKAIQRWGFCFRLTSFVVYIIGVIWRLGLNYTVNVWPFTTIWASSAKKNVTVP